MRVGAALLLVELCFSASVAAASFSEGRAAYDLNHVAEAERIYSAVTADTTATAADRAASERELARIAWLIDRDSKRALSHLEAAREAGDKPCDTAELIARVLQESGSSANVIGRGDSLITSCLEAGGADAIRTHVVAAMLDQAMAAPRNRARLVAETVAMAAKFTPDADVEAARVRLETALLAGDAPKALAAWKDYFWLDESDAPQALQDIGATAVFNNGVGPSAAFDSRLKLADLLMRAGFGQASERFALANRLDKDAAGSPILKRLQAYYGARKRFESRLLQEWRHFARQGNNESVLKAEKADLDKADVELKAALLAAAGETGTPTEVFRRAYGLVGTDVGTTDNYPSIHLGHVIEDHDDQVTQYGKSANIHFMAIDNMLSNGFTSWLWDGSAMVGGWTSNGVIVHIRPGYVQSPLRGYRMLSDSELRRTLIFDEHKLTLEDLAKLRTRPVATLNGLSNRLQLQLVDRIASVARAKSTDPQSFRRAFLGEYSRANLDQSIRKHEGRHAIDEGLGISATVEQSVLEYQAKLSELALTDYPRMALRNMDRNLEGNGPHDKAAAKIFQQFRAWMEVHTEQLIGYDPAVPVLAQLDKLSDDQIREIARSLDPLANGKPTPARLADLP